MQVVTGAPGTPILTQVQNLSIQDLLIQDLKAGANKSSKEWLDYPGKCFVEEKGMEESERMRPAAVDRMDAHCLRRNKYTIQILSELCSRT